MDERNFCTREAAQRLVDAGIVMETDFAWIRFTRSDRHPERWELWNWNKWKTYSVENYTLPAPCFTDVWRQASVDGMCKYWQGDVEMTAIWTDESAVFENDNPTDAAIDLLIWVVGQKKGEKG